jgi:hypothetical protein
MYDTDATQPAVTKKILSVMDDWKNELENPPADNADSSTQNQESTDMEWKDVTLETLKANRPDLLTALQEDLDQGEAAKKAAADQKALQEELTALKAEKQARVLQETIEGELRAAKLDPANKTACSEPFWATLRAAPDPAARKLLIEDRAQLLNAAAAGRTGPVTTAPGTGTVTATDPVGFRRQLMGA